MSVTIINRQRAVRVDLPAMQEFADRALIACLKLQKRKLGSLADLPEISVALVSDKRITQIHREFMKDATPTDVITFDHGEIVISLETAKRQARQFGTSSPHELRLYIVHGLLHLAGFDDRTAAGSREMKRVQERVLARCDG